MTLEATLPPGEAAARRWDVIVVGAGPAGTMAALELARLGTSVLVVDKASFPRYKVCGSCFNPGSLATLASAGLEGLVRRLDAVPLDGLLLAAGGRRARLPLPGGVALSREAFDAALVAAAIDAGAAFLPRAEARLGPPAAEARRLAVRHEEEHLPLEGRVLLVADGLGGGLLGRDGAFSVVTSPASRIGAGVIAQVDAPDYDRGTVYMACGRGGYVGVVRVEDGRLDLAAALDRSMVKRSGGLGAAAACILAEAGLPPLPNLEQLVWRGTPPLSRRARRPACDRAFVLGDAAGYVEPFTGEGIAWALAAGAAIATIAQCGCRRWQPSLADRWCRVYRQAVAGRQRTCRVVCRLLRHAGLTRAMVAALARQPGLASPVIRRICMPWTAAGAAP